MSKPGSGKSPRTYKGFCSYARKHGGSLREGSKHTIVTGPKSGRPVSLSRHSGDYNRGYSRSLLQQLLLIGIGALVPVCLVLIAFGN